MEDAVILERRLAEITAEKYRSKGYDVSREVSLDFFPGFKVDLVARKGDEAKVIEVKSRSTLVRNKKVKELARLLDAKPGWSFELIVVGEPETQDSPDNAQSFEGEAVLQRLQQAQRVLEAGFGEAAFLLAWSALEAAMRVIIKDEGVSIERITTSGYVLDQAVIQGVISRDEYRSLSGMMKYRNAIVHGFEVNDFGGELVTKLLDTVKRLLGTAPHDLQQ